MKIKKILRNLVFAILLVGYFFGILAVFNIVKFNNVENVYALGVDAKEVQQKLTDYGYYSGAINGLFDDATVGAIKRFQRDNGFINGSGGRRCHRGGGIAGLCFSEDLPQIQ